MPAIDATRVYQVGSVSRLVPEGQALDTARELSQAVAANGPLTVRTTEQIARDNVDWPHDAWPERQWAAVERIRTSADAAGGARVFTAKRTPIWSDC